MNYYIFNILVYSIITIGSIFTTVTIISKIVLKKNGFKVTFFLGMTNEDIKNMNKLSKEKKDIRILYYSMLFSTIAALGLFVIILFVVISEIVSRS